MYEEEDDDLPSQYRRLTAHLQTGSVDFNRRLAAYLTNHVAMRSALDQAIHNSYAQQFPEAPQFAHNQALFPSPFAANELGGNPFEAQLSPQAESPTQQSHPYRQSPYVATARPSQDRSASLQDTTSFESNLSASAGNASLFSRRMSMPAESNSSPAVRDAPSMSGLMSVPAHEPSRQTQTSTAATAGQAEQSNRRMGTIAEHVDFGPLSTTLPNESQMLLGSILSPNELFSQQLMGGNPFGYAFSAPAQEKPLAYRPGINMTLAPAALALTPQESFNETPGQYGSMNNPSLDADLVAHKGVSFANMTTPISPTGSGSVTPTADSMWDSFINDSSWA